MSASLERRVATLELVTPLAQRAPIGERRAECRAMLRAAFGDDLVWSEDDDDVAEPEPRPWRSRAEREREAQEMIDRIFPRGPR